MTTERVVEIPWVLSRLPRSGTILDIGSCGAEYLADLLTPTRVVHCLDPRPCHAEIPPGVQFHQTNLIHNQLPAASYDAILLISVLEHIGLPAYGLEFFPDGDRRALIEIGRLLKPQSPVFVTAPAGVSQITTVYRQYSPSDLHALFAGWRTEVQYWGYREGAYEPIEESEVEAYSYRARTVEDIGAGAVACIAAYRQGIG
jgi:hypothetical protein